MTTAIPTCASYEVTTTTTPTSQGTFVRATANLGAGPLPIAQATNSYPTFIGAIARTLLEQRHHARDHGALAPLRVHRQGTTLVTSATSTRLRPGAPVPAAIFDTDTTHALADLDLAAELPDAWIPQGIDRRLLTVTDAARLYLGGIALDPGSTNDFDLAGLILEHLTTPGVLPEGMSITTDGTVLFHRQLISDQWLPAGLTQDMLTDRVAQEMWRHHITDNDQDNVELTITIDPATMLHGALADRPDVATHLLWLGIDPYTLTH